MRFVVTQIGARRNYAVPRVLEKAGLLERFYTDIAGNVGLGKWLVKYGPWLGWGRLAARLKGRHLPEQLKSKTATFSTAGLWRVWFRSFCAQDSRGQFRQQLRLSRALGWAAVSQGFGPATHLYSMLGEFGPVVRVAKNRGLSVVTEVYILLSAEKILVQERQHFADWEPPGPNLDEVRREFPEQQTFLADTDLAICPAESVAEDLEQNFGLGRARSAVVPYGVDETWLGLPVEPQIGRVLFVGTAGLRKGVHYLAEAARQLHERGRPYEFRIAGEATPQIARQPACRHLSFLGRVPRAGIKSEYALADVFVLPSLAEGSAEASYEAMAVGLPVITTSATGSVVRHGREGWIVPERDSAGLASAVERVIEDRRLRAEMSRSARTRVREFTLERYGQRLLAAIQSRV